MKVDDFLLFTFSNDELRQCVGHVLVVGDNERTCTFLDVDTRMGYTFTECEFGNRQPWHGYNENGVRHTLVSHHLYAASATRIAKQGVVVVTFGDRRKYIGYVVSIDPLPQILFYHGGQPQMTINGRIVVASDLTRYPVGTEIVDKQSYAWVKS